MLPTFLAQAQRWTPEAIPSSDFPIEAVIGICVPFAAFVIVGVTLIVSINRRKMQRDDMEATLKMEMIERGYSAEDIERTLAARMGPSRKNCGHRGWKRAPEYQGQQRR